MGKVRNGFREMNTRPLGCHVTSSGSVPGSPCLLLDVGTPGTDASWGPAAAHGGHGGTVHRARSLLVVCV